MHVILKELYKSSRAINVGACYHLIWWCDVEKSTYLAGTGQFFAGFVIHLRTKLELFILEQQHDWLAGRLLFSYARFLWQAITHKLAHCEIKIQLFLKFHSLDPIDPWYIISTFYYQNWEKRGFWTIMKKVFEAYCCEGRGRVGRRVEYNFCNLKSILHCNSALSYLETVNGRKKSLFYIWSD